MTRTPWFCPSCRVHHAPHIDTCPGPVGTDKAAAPDSDHGPWKVPPVNWPPNRKTTFIPGYDGYKRWVDPCANCTGLCGNAACPKRVVMTMRGISGIAVTGDSLP